MKVFALATIAILAGGAFTGCQSSSGNDGVSRFASTPYYGPGSAPREAPASPESPEIPGRTDQDTLGGKLDGLRSESTPPAPATPAPDPATPGGEV